MMRKPYFAPLAMIVVLAMMLFACTSPQHRAVLDCADSLMNARPDSALTLLNTLLPDTNAMSKRDLMRFHLLRTNAENKCDTVLTASHAALMRRVCAYYDHKASPPWGDERGASRMLAHYLLGRCYSDMGEAPAALQEYLSAQHCVNKLTEKVDYHTLCCVHYQSGRMLLNEIVLSDAISEYSLAASSAYLDGDTITAIMCREHIASAYYMMNKPDSAILICKEVIADYQRMGRSFLTYGPLSLLSLILIEKNRIGEVGEYLQDFDTQSGLIDEKGNIIRGRELYYYVKGEYFLHKSMQDSAEFYFRRILLYDNSIEHLKAGYLGLSKLYKNKADSVYKYAELYRLASDSSYRQMSTQEIVRSKAMFDYSRNKAIADEKSISAERNKNVIVMMSAFLVSAILLAIILFLNESKKKKLAEKELSATNNEYSNLLLTYKETAERFSNLKKRYEEGNRIYQSMVEEQRNQIEKERDKYTDILKKHQESQQVYLREKMLQQQELDELEKKNGVLLNQLNIMMNLEENSEGWNPEQASLDSPIINRFHYLARKIQHPTDLEWSLLEDLVVEITPDFYKEICGNQDKLSPLEMRVTMLIHLQFINSEICVLLDKTSQNITNIRRRINKKLFNAKSAKKLDFNLKTIGKQQNV